MTEEFADALLRAESVLNWRCDGTTLEGMFGKDKIRIFREQFSSAQVDFTIYTLEDYCQTKVPFKYFQMSYGSQDAKAGYAELPALYEQALQLAVSAKVLPFR